MNYQNNLVKQEPIYVAGDFLITMFNAALKSNAGEIEIRTFKPRPASYFFSNVLAAADLAINLCDQGIDVYFGVNPRTGGQGRKENVHYLSAFHAEIDYGTLGHKKETEFKNFQEAFVAVDGFYLHPSIIIHSGGGFHCYWVLNKPLKVEDYGIVALENVNKALTQALNGDSGTHDLSRVLRVPGTINFKQPENPRPVDIFFLSDLTYEYEAFGELLVNLNETPLKTKAKQEKQVMRATDIKESTQTPATTTIEIDKLPVTDKIKSLILHGTDGSYSTRSEADMAVTIALVNKGLGENEIRQIFQTYPIGAKYREHSSPNDYLNHNIQKAKEMSNLTEEEMQNPLFISGSISKTDKGYHLKSLNFEEYMVKKYMIKILDQEVAFFKYNGKCYEQCTEKTLNNLCQNELAAYRHLFSKSNLNELIHYAIGDALVDSDNARINQIKYLTLQNGLYDLDAGKLIEHSRDIFTTNLLPYNYDPAATCPRFIQFLQEIFENDEEKINFVQEAVGYAFHKSLPTPAAFFLVGGGSNGKSVFINTIANLIGRENTSNVSFNALSNEYYVLELFQKMINISGETPQGKCINTDAVKAATAGDWITGRGLYKEPMKFRPFAKHFLAMNKPPVISDQSHGMWRRIWVLKFNKRFTEDNMDRQLEEKLVSELSGIFNWALEGYNKLKEKKFALSESETMKMSKQEYRDDINNDSINSFEKKYFVKSKDPKDVIVFNETYEFYKAYCQREEKSDLQDKNYFKKMLIDMGYKIKSSTKHDNKVCIFNVKLNLK
jgi:putative DNA primase/helicase